MIVHLNGWPGVGKLTVARLMIQWLQARLIDNHLLHDVAIRCTGINDPARWPLYGTVRAAAYRVLADRPRSETFVMTNALCLGAPREREAWRHVIALAETRAVPLVPVVLKANEAALLTRVQSPERRGRKLADAASLVAMIRSDRLLKPHVPERLDLDTSALALEIMAGDLLLRGVVWAWLTIKAVSGMHLPGQIPPEQHRRRAA